MGLHVMKHGEGIRVVRGPAELVRSFMLVTLAAVALRALPTAADQPPGETARVSVDSSGAQANGDSSSLLGNPAITADGRFVAFSSKATNLVPGDTNAKADIFVHDRLTGQTTRVSVDSFGGQSNGDSTSPAISADGNVVAFRSLASNLVAGDTNGKADIFVRDLVSGTTTRVSVDSLGNQANGDSDSPAVNGDGSQIAFSSKATNLVDGDTNGKIDVFVFDRNAATTSRVSVDSVGNQANGDSASPAINGDGSQIAFSSRASNLVDGDTNGKIDVFVYDRNAAATSRVSLSNVGGQGNGDSDSPAISADGSLVAFTSKASNLVGGDTNGKADVFVNNRFTGETDRVSLSSVGGQGNGDSDSPTISADGNLVAFRSLASNLATNDLNGKTDIFVHDRQSGETTVASINNFGAQATGNSDAPELSGDGRFVAFSSVATNLVSGDTNGVADVFVHRVIGVTTRVSVDSFDNQGNGDSGFPSVSADGRFVAFSSRATNLVPGDTNGRVDIFVHDRLTGQTTRVSVDSLGGQSNGDSTSPAISADGNVVAFRSLASNLVPGDTNGKADIFIHNISSGSTTRVSVDSFGNQANGDSDSPAINSDGSVIAFSSKATNLVDGDTNGKIDIFVNAFGSVTRVSVDSFGNQANDDSASPSLSADGNVVAFSSKAKNLVDGDTNGKIDIFVNAFGSVTRVSVTTFGVQGNGDSTSPAVNSDGSVVAFTSKATNLVGGDTNGKTDVFVHDSSGVTTRVSVSSASGQGNNNSEAPAISADGNLVAFRSFSSNLVSGDANGKADIFVNDRLAGTTTRVSVSSTGIEANGDCPTLLGDPAMSSDGRFVAFSSVATNLVPDDTNDVADVFVHDGTP